MLGHQRSQVCESIYLVLGIRSPNPLSIMCGCNSTTPFPFCLPCCPAEVRQQHQLFQGKREAINKLNRSIQGREGVELVESRGSVSLFCVLQS